MGGDEGLARCCRRVVVALSLSHVRVGSEDGVWARCHHRCVIVVAYGGREGVAGMQTCAAGMGMSAGQQDHTRTHTCAIPIM